MFWDFGNLMRDLSGSARNGHPTLKIVRYSRARFQPLYMNIKVAIRIVAVLVITAAITYLCFRLTPVNATTAGFTYLIAILLIATAWGLLEAMVASVTAVLCFNYFFFPPIGTFTIAEPRNWVALFAFLVTSIVASQLSARAKRQAHEAMERREETERLYALSRAILLTEAGRRAPKEYAKEIAQIFDLLSVALYERDSAATYHAGPSDLPGVEERLREAATLGTLFRDDLTGVTVTPIHLGGQPIASLAISGRLLSDSALQAISNLIAIGLEKVRGQEAASQAEAARRSEELKSTLLDAIAHEFKTPLTSIKAAASALLLNAENSTEQQRELATIVDEEADRMTWLVTEAIQMARIEAGEIQLNRTSSSLPELLSKALERLRLLTEDRTVDVKTDPNAPMIEADTELLELAIRQVIDNALKYSPPPSAIHVQLSTGENGIIISIRDEGPGIPEVDQAHVFEKFYRGSNTRSKLAGTGMGLAVARQILRSHGGDIQLATSSEKGSEFIIALPIVSEAKRR
jgi:two-component system, OmpR family, sensor histidine kinase KdpD